MCVFSNQLELLVRHWLSLCLNAMTFDLLQFAFGVLLVDALCGIHQRHQSY